MKKLALWCLLLLLFFVVLCLSIQTKSVEINNTTSADQIITIDHGLEKLLLAKAIFYVRDGFEEVTASDLSKEVGLTLECKRQVSQTQFYYVIKGDGYRCFMITNDADVVQEVLVIHQFVTIEETQDWIKTYGHHIHIAESPEHGFCDLWRDIGRSSIYRNSLFTLQNGVMIMQSVGNAGNSQYFYFTDEEWKNIYSDWNGFVILPIDKQ